MKLPIASRRKQLEQEVQALEKGKEALARYQRLRKVYHINLDDAKEADMSLTEKIQYVQSVVALLDQFSARFKNLETEQKLLKKAQKKAHNRTADRRHKSYLMDFYDVDIEKGYSLRGFLTWLGKRQIPVWDPIAYFTEKESQLEQAIKKIREVTNWYARQVPAQQSYVRGGDTLSEIYKIWEREMRRNASSRTRSSRSRGSTSFGSIGRSNSSWGGSFGSSSVFSGGGFKGGGFKGGW